MRYRLEVRLTPADVGQRVVIRWRQPARGGGEVVADVLGILEEADAGSFAVRTRDGKLVVVPAERALAGKTVPPPPARNRGALPAPTPRLRPSSISCAAGVIALRHRLPPKGTLEHESGLTDRATPVSTVTADPEAPAAART